MDTLVKHLHDIGYDIEHIYYIMEIFIRCGDVPIMDYRIYEIIDMAA